MAKEKIKKFFTREEIMRAIYKAGYPSLNELSEIIGGTPQNISDKINRQSPAFMAALENANVFPVKNDNSKQIAKGHHNNIAHDIKELKIDYGEKSNDLELLKSAVIRLSKDIENCMRDVEGLKTEVHRLREKYGSSQHNSGKRSAAKGE